MGKATQKNRLLAIATPLGEDYLLLNKLRMEERISELFEIDVELLYDEQEDNSFELSFVDGKTIIGKAVNISITQEDGGKRWLTGMVNNFTVAGRNRRFTAYYATIVPHVWLLTRNIQSRIFQHKTVPDILREVFEGFEVKYQLQGDYKPRNYCVQYQESDFAFASRLMEEEGIYYYFEHGGEKEKMILRDDFKSPEDCPFKSDVPIVNEDLNAGEPWESAIKQWHTDYKLQSGKVTNWDYHFQLPKKKLEADQTSIFDAGGNRQLEVYTFPAGYARKYDGIDKSGGERPADLNNIFQDNKRTVGNRMAALDAQYKTASGLSDCVTLTSGYRFQLKNHPNKDFNIKYIVLSVKHEAEQTPDYIVGDTKPKAYQNSFTCLPHGAGSPEYRPTQKTPKPHIYGSQTAIVVGPGGEEIFTDKYGRVKVQFHWDRDGKYNPDSACWLRVATSIAGNKWGTMFIPRIGQEVVVDFLGGDPDQPIIVGSVYNPETMPHYELPKFKTLSYIKTRTSPDDGKGFNELRFEDKQGKEQVFIHSQRRMDTRVRESYYETCGGNRQERIGMRTDNKPGGNLAISVGGNYDLHVKDSMFVGIDGKLNHTVKKDEIKNVQANYARIVTGKSEVNAREIILEAMTKISLKVGGSFITIDLSGVSISGPMVKINSGGAGTPTSTQTIDDPLDAEPADTGEPGYLDKPRSGGGRGRNRRTLTGQHAPPFATKVLPGGAIQVGNSIVINPSPTDPDFQNKVLGDLTEMSNHPSGMQTLNEVNNSGHTATIQHTATPGGNATTFDSNQDATPAGQPALGGGTGTGNGTNSTIDYNPDFEPPTAADPSINRPADVGLNHELSHFLDGANATDDNTPDPAHPGQAMAETNAIERDNAYRDDRGIPRRTDHSTL